MARNHKTELIECRCMQCGKRSTRVWNSTLDKWARVYICECGSREKEILAGSDKKV